MSKNITIALAGNPNCGKTTIFNNLTGARQHVGNWPGVTVEKKEGTCNYEGYSIKVVDLPGIYSLTAYSPDEVVARDYVIEEKPDLVVDIVDASNLERNLYLATQFLEMEVPLIIALNMMDAAKARGYQIDVKKLSESLGVPVVPMVANRSRGTRELLQEIVKVALKEKKASGVKVDYGKAIESEIDKLEEAISVNHLSLPYPSRWLAIKLLEEDEEAEKKARLRQGVKV